MQHPNRKTIRLAGYDYNAPGYYFITVCTKNKEKLLCDIRTNSVTAEPCITYSKYGFIANDQLQAMANHYPNISLETFVVMPNHIHLLLHVHNISNSHPTTAQNVIISQFIGTFKRFCNRQYGHNIWQYRSYDHIIRDEQDYLKIWNYIDSNPGKWTEDCFYIE